jgi:metallo-beta-lactamase class B
MAHTLKPYVDAHYRTLPDAPHTGVGGSSAGALIALYAALKYPDVFGRAALFSTASWLTGSHLLEMARAATPGRPLPRFWFVSGAYETPSGELADDQRHMVDALVAAGFPVGTAVRSSVVPQGKHAEWFWRQEFPAAYQWLFAAP